MKPHRFTLTHRLSEELSAETWYNRLNLLNKMKRFCQYCTGLSIFWHLVGIMTLIEPVLCSNKPVGNIWWAQLIVLAISSGLYCIQLIGVASREWDKIVMIQALSMGAQSMIMPVANFTPLKLFIFFTAEGEYILEFCCLVGGWMTIYIYPGLAVLRCFRVFRLLWFYEVEVFKNSTEYALSPIFGRDFVLRAFKVLKFAIKALTALGNEMFRLTSATRGGLLLMMVFFYSAFVLGTTIWIETGYNQEFCASFQQCSYTLMRLTFYDGTGFDFAYTLTDKHRFLFFLCIVYMCLTSFGILNGLVGIFGTAFAAASDDAFRDDEEDDEGEENNGDSAGGDDGGGDDGGGDADPVVHKLKSFKRYQDKQNGGNDDDNDDGDDENDDNEGGVDIYNAEGDFPQMLAKMPSMRKAPSMSKMEVKALQSQLKGALGGKSAFALKELTKMAAAENAKPAAPRRTFRDIVASKGLIGAGGGGAAKASGVHPLLAAAAAASAVASPRDGPGGVAGSSPLGSNNNSSSDNPLPSMMVSNESPDKDKLKKHLGMFGAKKEKPNKNIHAAVGMFANLKGKSSRNLVPHSSGSAGNGATGGGGGGAFKDYVQHQAMAGGAISSAEIKSINASVHTLQATVEKQNETILALFRQIQVMNQQLHAIYPTIEIPTVAEPVTESNPLGGAELPRRFALLKMGVTKAATEIVSEIKSEITEIAHVAHVHLPGTAEEPTKPDGHTEASSMNEPHAEHHMVQDAMKGAVNFIKHHGHTAAVPAVVSSNNSSFSTGPKDGSANQSGHSLFPIHAHPVVAAPAEGATEAPAKATTAPAAVPTTSAFKGAASMFRAPKQPQPAVAHPQVSAAVAAPATTPAVAGGSVESALTPTSSTPTPETHTQQTAPAPVQQPAAQPAVQSNLPSETNNASPAGAFPPGRTQLSTDSSAVGFSAANSVGSFGSIELIEPRESREEQQRSTSRSKPRKSPSGHRHGSSNSNSNHNGSSQSMILGAMGKIKAKIDPLGEESDDTVHSFSIGPDLSSERHTYDSGAGEQGREQGGEHGGDQGDEPRGEHHSPVSPTASSKWQQRSPGAQGLPTLSEKSEQDVQQLTADQSLSVLDV